MLLVQQKSETFALQTQTALQVAHHQCAGWEIVKGAVLRTALGRDESTTSAQLRQK